MFDFLVVGDINVDLCTRNNLQFAFKDLIENGVNIFEPFDELPGGTGYNFARFAKQYGYAPLLIGKVGNDLLGKFLKKMVKENIDPKNKLFTSESLSTGKAFIVRDKNDIRLLIDNSPNANSQLNENDILSLRVLIKKCENIYISGYTIRKLNDNSNHSRIEAIRRLFEIVNINHPMNVIFDVVPHKIYDMYSFDEFRDLIRPVNIIISEVATIRRFLRMGIKEEVISEKLARETSTILKNYYPKFILRWGPSGTDYELLWDGKYEEVHSTIHHLLDTQEKRGFGDKLTLDALKNRFGIKPILSESSAAY